MRTIRSSVPASYGKMVPTADPTRLNRLVAPRIFAALLLSGSGSVQVAPLSLRRITSFLNRHVRFPCLEPFGPNRASKRSKGLVYPLFLWWQGVCSAAGPAFGRDNGNLSAGGYVDFAVSF